MPYTYVFIICIADKGNKFGCVETRKSLDYNDKRYENKRSTESRSVTKEFVSERGKGKIYRKLGHVYSSFYLVDGSDVRRQIIKRKAGS